MIINSKFDYHPLDREDSPNGRKYVTPDGNRTPSVTTILSATQPEDKKEGLSNWRKRVGNTEADRITYEASNRGTTMHRFLEKWILGEDTTPGSNPVQKQAHGMSQVIIDKMLIPNLTEIWGVETGLYFPHLYAGTTDLVGTWGGVPSIMDFKQTNKPKKDEYITDYFLQLAAYAIAHNEVYGTDIKQGVVMMCSVDLVPQQWVLSGDKFEYYSKMWWNRLEQYYQTR